MSSSLLNREQAVKAVWLAKPSILAAMEAKVLKRGDLHIVVMDPTILYPDFAGSGRDPSQAILYEESIGEPAKWERDYAAIARAKTLLSWKCGLSSQEIVERYPYLLQDSDVAYWGSVVRGGLVIGASGVQSYFDQWACGLVADSCQALSIERMKVEIQAKPELAFLREFWRAV